MDAFEKLMERVKQRVRSGGFIGQGGRAVKLPTGKPAFEEAEKTFFLDILPYRVQSDTHPFAKPGDIYDVRPFLTHRRIGPQQRTVICPRSVNRSCPICEELARMRRDPEVDKEAARALAPQKRQLYNIFDLSAQEKGVQVWDVAYNNFGALLEKELKAGPEECYGYFRLDEGRTLKIRFEEGAFKTSRPWFEATRIDFLKREEPYPESILDEVADLDALLDVLEYDVLIDILFGAEKQAADVSGEGHDHDGDEAPPPRRRVSAGGSPAADAGEAPPPRRRLAADEPDDDAPPRRRGAAKAMQGGDASEEAAAAAGPDRERCKACGGSGENSKGGVCRPCHGKGYVIKKKDDDLGEDAPPPSRPESPAEDDAGSEPDDDDLPPPRRSGGKAAATDASGDAPPPRRQSLSRTKPVARQEEEPEEPTGADEDDDDLPPPRRR